MKKIIIYKFTIAENRPLLIRWKMVASYLQCFLAEILKPQIAGFHYHVEDECHYEDETSGTIYNAILITSTRN